MVGIGSASSGSIGWESGGSMNSRAGENTVGSFGGSTCQGWGGSVGLGLGSDGTSKGETALACSLGAGGHAHWDLQAPKSEAGHAPLAIPPSFW